MKKIIIGFFCFVLSLFGISNAGTLYSQPYSQVHAGHILVDSEQEAKELKTKIDNGESFEALAKKYSKCPSKRDGGDLGYFGKRQMVKPFEDAAFSTQTGEVSEPVQTQFGWHLIKVYDKR